MLTYTQLKLNLAFYKVCYKLCLLPLKLDDLTFRATTGVRYYVWTVQFLLSSAHGAFMAIRLLQLLLVDSEEINLIYFSVHATMALMGILSCLYYTMLITHTEDHLLLCNELLLQVERPAAEQNGLAGLGKDLLYLRKFSVPEIMLLLIPMVMSFAPTVAIPVVYVFQHESSQFLYSLCPEKYRSATALLLFGVVETWLTSVRFSTCFHFTFVTATLLQKSIDICNEETARLRDGAIVRAMRVVRRYREFQLEAQLYNLMCSGIIYMTKLLFVTMAILGFFITIRFGTELPVLMTGINVVMGVLGVFLFNFLYDAAVWMPIKFEDLKHYLCSCSIKMAGPDRTQVHKELKSLPRVVLRIGSFEKFEQTTTPEFVDVVVQQICSLLLTFR